MPAKKTARKSVGKAAKKAARKAVSKTVKKTAAKAAEKPVRKAPGKTAKASAKRVKASAAKKAPTFEEIATAAFLKHLKRAGAGIPDDPTADWLEAERELRGA